MHDSVDITVWLDEIRRRHPQIEPDMVTEIVRATSNAMRDDLGGNEAALLIEIEELARTLADARAEISALGADDITASHIPSTTDELDAIVAHTATATDSILECCEQLDGVSLRLGSSDAQILQEVLTRIYEACSFQDITGQRITKVVATLQAIEAKVTHLIKVFAPESSFNRAAPMATRGSVKTSALLNGPQLPTAAMHQSDIDALLASFD